MSAAALLSVAVAPSSTAVAAVSGAPANDDGAEFVDVLMASEAAAEESVVVAQAPAPALPLPSPLVNVEPGVTATAQAASSDLELMPEAGPAVADSAVAEGEAPPLDAATKAESGLWGPVVTPDMAKVMGAANLTTPEVHEGQSPTLAKADSEAAAPTPQPVSQQAAVPVALNGSVLTAIRAVSQPANAAPKVESVAPALDETVEGEDAETAASTPAADKGAPRTEAPAPVRPKPEFLPTVGRGDGAPVTPSDVDGAEASAQDDSTSLPAKGPTARQGGEVAAPPLATPVAVATPPGNASVVAPADPSAAPVANADPSHQAAPPSRVSVDTVAQIAAQIGQKTEGRVSRFEMSLASEGLGQVDVSLDIDADGQLAARLAFDSPAAAADMRGRADELRRQLEDAGFRVAQDGLDFSERRSGEEGGSSRQRLANAFAGAERINAQADSVAAPPAWKSLSAASSGVDVRV